MKIRIGNYAHFGIPSRKEYYRIEEVSNNKDEIEKWWVRATNKPKSELNLKWIKTM
ncbi:hypothetical protein [Reichenbachiella sp.]|uniref:hypothetical protein n=1 Tax=Reichenbachiella sp. TaxID=2184521 RepID=UPI003B59F3AC